MKSFTEPCLLLLPVMLISTIQLGSRNSQPDRIRANTDGSITVRLMSDNHEVQQLTNPKVVLRQTLIGENEISWIGFSPDGRILVTENKVLRLFDTKTGLLKAKLMKTNGNLGTFIFSPDGKMLAVSTSSNKIDVWDVETGQLKRTLTGHKGSIWEIEFSPDGKQLLTSSSDKTVKLWDVKTGQLKATIREHKGFLLKGAFIKASFSPDGNTFITTSSDDKTPRLWDAKTGALKMMLKGHTENVYDHSFSPNGQLVATASFDNTVKLWDTRSGLLKATLGGCYAYDFEFSPDGRLLATACSDGAARLWDVLESQLIKILKMTYKRATTIDFSPNGQTLAVCHPDIDKCELWDVLTGQLLATLTAKDGYKVKFSPDSRLLVALDDKRRIKIWNVRSGELISTLDGAQWPAVFSPDGRVLATAGEKNTVLLWDVVVR